MLALPYGGGARGGGEGIRFKGLTTMCTVFNSLDSNYFDNSDSQYDGKR
jgi:hypothetical protein